MVGGFVLMVFLGIPQYWGGRGGHHQRSALLLFPTSGLQLSGWLVLCIRSLYTASLGHRIPLLTFDTHCLAKWVIMSLDGKRVDNRSKDMGVSQTPLPLFEENVTEFVKSKFGSFLFFVFPQRKKTALILNRKVFPSHRLSSELFGNIQDLKENFQS